MISRRSEWDNKLEASRVVEVLDSPFAAIVEFYKLAGTFRAFLHKTDQSLRCRLTSGRLSKTAVIKQRELVLLSCAATLPSAHKCGTRIIGGSTSIDHPDVPYSKSHMRFISRLSGYIFTATDEGVELVQMQDFGPMANYVPSSALRLALTAILPKTLLSFKNGALKIEADGSLDFCPPPLAARLKKENPGEDASRRPKTMLSDPVHSDTKMTEQSSASPNTVLSPALTTNDSSRHAQNQAIQAHATKVAMSPPPSFTVSKDDSKPFPHQEEKVAQSENDTTDDGQLRTETDSLPGDEDNEEERLSTSWLRLQSPSLNATIDTRNKRLSYFGTGPSTTSSGAVTPSDEQQKRLADILSTEEGRRALRRLSKAVSNSELVVEDGSSELDQSTESLCSPNATSSPIPEHDGTSDDSGDQRLMEELADAMGLQLNVTHDGSDNVDGPSSAAQSSSSSKVKLLDAKPNTQEASRLGWAAATANRAFKSATYSVTG